MVNYSTTGIKVSRKKRHRNTGLKEKSHTEIKSWKKSQGKKSQGKIEPRIKVTRNRVTGKKSQGEKVFSV